MIFLQPDVATTREISNARASLTIDTYGGAIVDFHLIDQKINPLTFRFTKEQMPENNRAGAPYQGHFLCLGRWGEPSVGEINAGMPNHGHFANIQWSCSQSSEGVIEMQSVSNLEGLEIKRAVRLHDSLSLFMVDETVININPLGRLYNMVQHPTLAAPFLNSDTRIECNASRGFHYDYYSDPDKYSSNWPYGVYENRGITDLRRSNAGYSAVFSFIVDEQEEFGWIVAYSPLYNLLFGYIWVRTDYPWINVWQDWQDGKISYRGIEFGTTGIHKPFNTILELGKSSVFNTDTLRFIDAGAMERRRYLSFMDTVPADFEEQELIPVLDGAIMIERSKKNYSLKIRSELAEFLKSGS